MKKRVLVTGGSRGIGRATAQRLAAEGWDVIVHYVHSQDQANAIAEACGSSTPAIQADLSKANGADLLMDAVMAAGRLDALVNNAGIYIPQLFAEATATDVADVQEATFQVNLWSPVTLMKRAVDHFMEAESGGAIVNVASRVGFKSEAGAAAYAASKAALISYTRSLAAELGSSKVRLFGIAPGWVETSMAREGMGSRLPEILSGIPLGRMASPEDCANAINFLLSPASEYLSGHVIDINGASYYH